MQRRGIQCKATQIIHRERTHNLFRVALGEAHGAARRRIDDLEVRLPVHEAKDRREEVGQRAVARRERREELVVLGARHDAARSREEIPGDAVGRRDCAADERKLPTAIRIKGGSACRRSATFCEKRQDKKWGRNVAGRARFQRASSLQMLRTAAIFLPLGHSIYQKDHG
jgi:hypothetical protein